VEARRARRGAPGFDEGHVKEALGGLEELQDLVGVAGGRHIGLQAAAAGGAFQVFENGLDEILVVALEDHRRLAAGDVAGRGKGDGVVCRGVHGVPHQMLPAPGV